MVSDLGAAILQEGQDMAPQKPIYPYAFCEDPNARGRFPWLEWLIFVGIVLVVLWPTPPIDDPTFMQPLFDGVEYRVLGEHQFVEMQGDEGFLIRGPIHRSNPHYHGNAKILLVNRGTSTHMVSVVLRSDDFVEQDGTMIIEPESRGLIPIRPTYAGASQWSVTLKPIRTSERR